MFAWYKKQSTLVKILLAIPFLILLVVAGLFSAGGLASFKPRNRADREEISRDKTNIQNDSNRVRQDTGRVKDIAGEISGNNQQLGKLAENAADENRRAADSNKELGNLADAIRQGLGEDPK